MKMSPFGAWSASLLFVSFAAVASEVSTLQPVPGMEFREAIAEPRPVSSTSVVGMLAVWSGQPEPLTDAAALAVYLPDALTADAKIRVEIESADGRYRGYGVFQGAAPGASWVRVPLLSQGEATRRPRDLRVEDLAVSISLLGSAKTGSRLIASWQVQDGPPSFVRVYVNSRRANLAIPSRDAAPGRCRRLNVSAALSFDHVCDVAFAQLQTDDGVRMLELMRKDGFARELIRVAVPLPGETVAPSARR